MEKVVFYVFILFGLIGLLLFLEDGNNYKTYVEIDGCVFLETNHSSGYGSSVSTTLISCDSAVVSKYKPKLGVKF